MSTGSLASWFGRSQEEEGGGEEGQKGMHDSIMTFQPKGQA